MKFTSTSIARGLSRVPIQAITETSALHQPFSGEESSAADATGGISQSLTVNVEISMNALIFLATAVSTYYVMAIVQTLLHRVFGHRNRIRKIFVNHALGHHGKYRKDALLTDRYLDSETYVMFYYAIPIAVIGAGVFLVGGLLILLGYLAGVAVAFWLHLYLHEQYHLADSPLRRFRWFRRKRELHFVHHRHVRRNYAIVEFWIDRITGTLEDVPVMQD